jgi:hypothetical protein
MIEKNNLEKINIRKYLVMFFVIILAFIFVNDYRTLNGYGNSEKVKEITSEIVRYSFCSNVANPSLDKMKYDTIQKEALEDYCNNGVFWDIKGKYYHSFFKQEALFYPVLYGNGKYKDFYFLELKRLNQELIRAERLDAATYKPYANLFSFAWKAILVVLILFLVIKYLIVLKLKNIYGRKI